MTEQNDPHATEVVDEEELARFRSIVEGIAAEIPPFLTGKHRSYGKHNMDKHGQLGATMRIDDKMERIRNLLRQGETSIIGESLEDTWLDTIGYGFLGLMLARGEEI